MARARARRPATKAPAKNLAKQPTKPARAPEREAAPAPLRWPVAAGVGLIALVAYLLTASRDIFPGDSPEFVTDAFVGGVAHPPGYPLLSMLGVLFALLPIDPLPFRINLISVLCHTATVVLVYLTAERLTRNALASAAPALLLAFAKGFWRWSVVAETFPLNDLLAALAIYLLVLWTERPERRPLLFGAATALGLGFANQQTIVLLGPAVLVLLYMQRIALRGAGRALGTAVLCGIAAALLPYTYILVAAGRHPELNWDSIQGVPDLLRSMLRLDYGAGQLVPYSSLQGGTGIDRMIEFLKESQLVILALAIPGAVLAYRKHRWYAAFVGTAFFFTGPVFLVYANADPAVDTARIVLERFYLLPQVIVAPLAALGIVQVAELVRRRMDPAPPWLATAASGAALAIAALQLVLGYGGADRSNDHVARDFAMDILNTAPQDSIILSSGDHVFLSLLYISTVEHVRPDVTVLSWPVLGFDWYQRETRLHHPEINLPLARYNEPDGLLTFVRSNPNRTILLTSEETDQTLEGKFGVVPVGLTLPVTDATKVFDLNDLAAQNTKLLASYRIPTLEQIDRDSYERFVVLWYAAVPYRVGTQFEEKKLYNDARTWYQRSLQIDPEFPASAAGLKRIEGK